jgi:hypothetical protein
MPWPAEAEELPQGVENQTDAITGEPDPEYGGPDPEGEGDHPKRHNDLADAVNRTWLELGINPSAGWSSVGARITAAEVLIAAAEATLAGKQPLDADLTTLAANGAPSSLGLELLKALSPAAARGLTGAETAGAAAAAQAAAIAASQPLDSDLTTLAANGAPSTVGLALLIAANAAAARALVEAAAWPYKLSTGNWALPLAGNISTASLAQGTAKGCPLILAAPGKIERIGIEVTTAAAGSVIRLGVYDATGTFNSPGSLIVDAGTVSAATTGAKEVVLGAAVEIPQACWLVAVAQTEGAPTVRGSTTPFVGPPGKPSSLNQALQFGVGVKNNASPIAGAFPANFPSPVNDSTAPRIAVSGA